MCLLIIIDTFNYTNRSEKHRQNARKFVKTSEKYAIFLSLQKNDLESLIFVAGLVAGKNLPKFDKYLQNQTKKISLLSWRWIPFPCIVHPRVFKLPNRFFWCKKGNAKNNNLIKKKIKKILNLISIKETRIQSCADWLPFVWKKGMKLPNFELIFRSCDARKFVSPFRCSHLFHFWKWKKKRSNLVFVDFWSQQQTKTASPKSPSCLEDDFASSGHDQKPEIWLLLRNRPGDTSWWGTRLRGWQKRDNFRRLLKRCAFERKETRWNLSDNPRVNVIVL